jgi:hypothetical protein
MVAPGTNPEKQGAESGKRSQTYRVHHFAAVATMVGATLVVAPGTHKGCPYAGI